MVLIYSRNILVFLSRKLGYQQNNIMLWNISKLSSNDSLYSKNCQPTYVHTISKTRTHIINMGEGDVLGRYFIRIICTYLSLLYFVVIWVCSIQHIASRLLHRHWREHQSRLSLCRWDHPQYSAQIYAQIYAQKNFCTKKHSKSNMHISSVLPYPQAVMKLISQLTQAFQGPLAR